MRRTVTLDDDVERLVRERMEREGVGFTRALNDAVRDGVAGPSEPERFVTKTFAMGPPLVDLTHVNAVLADWDLEDYLDLTRRLEQADG